MKKIALLFTGGTIAMKVNSKLQGAVPSISPKELVETLHEVTEFDHLEGYEFSELPSPSITPEKWRLMKDRIDDFLDDDDYAGVVVVHGTDTLEETAFYLDCVSTSHKPVVLTGSMKNASQLGYDGLTNLDASIRTIMSGEAMNRGVLVVMNYQIHAAREVTKTHTLNLDTFKSIEFGPLGIIDDDDVLFYRKQTLKNIYRLKNTYEDKVGLVKVVVGMGSELLDHYVELGYKGLVIEAFGRGNVPADMMDGIKRARQAGVEIVVVSRVMAGRVLDTYGYVGGGKDLVRHDCILGRNLSGQKARILLMVALGNQFKHEQLRDIFS